MRPRFAFLALVLLLAAVPAGAREQTFQLRYAEGATISQKIDVPVDRPGVLVVEAEWGGGRGLKLWIEDGAGRDLARWGGNSPGRLVTTVTEEQVAAGKPLTVRIRSIGRNGSVDGWMKVSYPSLSDGPEEPPEPEPALPPEVMPREDPAPGERPWADRPHAGTRWPAPLARLRQALEAGDGAAALQLRAILMEAASLSRAYVALGVPPPGLYDDLEEDGADEAELERRFALEDLGRDNSALIRLADQAALGEDQAADLRRVLASMAGLVRRREENPEAAEEAQEALVALTEALEEVLGLAPPGEPGPQSSGGGGTARHSTARVPEPSSS
jgi:hypothetical protein